MCKSSEILINKREGLPGCAVHSPKLLWELRLVQETHVCEKQNYSYS